MTNISKKPAYAALLALTALPVTATLSAQQGDMTTAADTGDIINVFGSVPTDISQLPDGPDIEGVISARSANGMRVATSDGSASDVLLSTATEIRGSGGFLGLGSKELAARSLLNGLPVTVETVRWEDGLVAKQIKLKTKDLRTAEMIRGGTAQQFAEQGAAIDENARAAEALRGRMGDIDKYNIKGTTNVYFDTGKWSLSGDDESRLCQAAMDAETTENALLLVVGYTDSVGDEDYNQILSERRAGRVVNYLQQKCSWAPWRMLSPTGMAESDPLADNSTAEGRAQNRRVSVNILVSKAVDETS